LLQQGQHCQGFIFSKERGYKITTFNFVNLYGFVVKSMDDYISFQIYIFYKRSIWGGISLTNKHMFILDGHGSHVTFEAIEQSTSIQVGYGYVTFTYMGKSILGWYH
jgi:hypothetical protein